MNEFQAALGLLQLKYLSVNIERRRDIAGEYRRELRGIRGISFLPELENTDSNYAYFPVFVDKKEYGMTRDSLYEELKRRNIYCRKYFYPLISMFHPYRELPSARPENLTIAENAAGKVICLPIFPAMEAEIQGRIVREIKSISAGR